MTFDSGGAFSPIVAQSLQGWHSSSMVVTWKPQTLPEPNIQHSNLSAKKRKKKAGMDFDSSSFLNDFQEAMTV